MAKSYNVSFNILGNLDGSLLSALQRAANGMRGLQNAARSVSGALARQANSLNAARGLMRQVESYRALESALKANVQAQANERLNMMNLMTRQQSARKQLDAMTASYKQLVKARTQARQIKTARDADLSMTQRELQTARRQFEVSRAAGNAQAMAATSGGASGGVGIENAQCVGKAGQIGTRCATFGSHQFGTRIHGVE